LECRADRLLAVLWGVELVVQAGRGVIERGIRDEGLGFLQLLDCLGLLRRSFFAFALAKAAARLAPRLAGGSEGARGSPGQRPEVLDALLQDSGLPPVPKKEAIVLRPNKELVNVSAARPPLLDGNAYVTGTASFGADVKLPGLLVAVIARPPVVGGTVRRLDDKRAVAVAGVKRIVKMPAAKPPWKFQPWGGVAVVAEGGENPLTLEPLRNLGWDLAQGYHLGRPAPADQLHHNATPNQ